MKLTQSVKVYLGFVIAAGSLVIAVSLLQTSLFTNHTLIVTAAFFLVLGAIMEALPIHVDREQWVSISSTASIASILLVDVYTAVIIRVLGTLLTVRKTKKGYDHLFNTPIYKSLFNGSMRGITVFLAGLTYRELGNLFPTPVLMSFNLVGLFGLISVYFATDAILFSILLSLLSRSKFIDEVGIRLWIVVYQILLSPLGVFLAGLYTWQGVFPVILMAGPFLFARHAFEQNVQIRQTFQETITAFSLAVEAKDPYTNGHSHRVAELTVGIAKQMKRSVASIDALKSAAILHDIGKIGVSDNTLNKSATLLAEERVELQKHAVVGAKILEQVKQLQTVARIVRYHHVYYAGGGYPEVLQGDTVPIEAYILAVADAFDAMTTDRYYRKAMPELEALQRLKEGAGIQFHPAVVESFMAYWANKE